MKFKSYMKNVNDYFASGFGMSVKPEQTKRKGRNEEQKRREKEETKKTVLLAKLKKFCPLLVVVILVIVIVVSNLQCDKGFRIVQT